MQIERLDHLVLTVRDVDATVGFYERVLGMRLVTFGTGRKALEFGQSKINLHEASNPIKPHAKRAEPGTADLCFIVATAIDEVVQHLNVCGVAIEDGPVQRTGALGPITSVYIRDPDENLIELSQYRA